MTPDERFADHYGLYAFIVEAAGSGVLGSIQDVRKAQFTEVLNYIAFRRSEAALTRDRMPQSL